MDPRFRTKDFDAAKFTLAKLGSEDVNMVPNNPNNPDSLELASITTFLYSCMIFFKLSVCRYYHFSTL